jgi:hypothetical protein
MYSDESHAVALDSQNNVYLTGLTVSPNFPMMNAFQPTIGDTSGDAFVTKMNASGSALLYSTYLGGGNPPGPGEDNGQGIVVDAQGYAYVTGYTQSPNFPITAGSYQPFFRGYYDAFVTKLVPAGNALVYSTFIGGSLNPPYGDDEAYDIAVDALGQAHITGKTYSPDFPVVNAVQPTPGDVYDGFVSKLNAAGSALLYSTFLGGDYQLPNFNGEDAGTGIYIDNLGNAVIGGGTSSYNFPVVNAYQPANAGESDGFISKIRVSAPAGTATVPPANSPTRTATPQGTGTSQPAATATRTVAGTAAATRSTTPTVTGTVTACAIQFTDLPLGSTFYTWIRCLACQGIINGYPDGTFRPNNSVTRGQLAKIVSNAAGFIEPVTGHTFQDVLPGSTFYDYVGRLAARNIVQGYPCGGPGEPCVPPTNLPYFRPNSGVTRGQTSKIVAIAANLPAPAPGTQSFEDVPPGSTFWPWIEALAARGVVNGYPCGGPGEPCVPPTNRPYFRPGAGMTRGQASKVVSIVFLPDCQARN